MLFGNFKISFWSSKKYASHARIKSESSSGQLTKWTPHSHTKNKKFEETFISSAPSSSCQSLTMLYENLPRSKACVAAAMLIRPQIFAGSRYSASSHRRPFLDRAEIARATFILFTDEYVALSDSKDHLG